MVIAFYNNKGGVGKTTLATHAFRYAANSTEEPWAFYDADPQRDGFSWLVGHNNNHIERGTVALGDAATGAEVGIATVELARALEHDHIVVDAPPREDFLDRLREHVEPDLIVVPVNGRLAIDGAVNVLEAAQGLRSVIVFNMTDPKHEFSKSEVAAVKKMGVELYPVAIPRNDAIRKAELIGVPAWEIPHAGRTHAIQALRSFCEWLAAGADVDDMPLEGPERPRQGRGDIWDRLSI